MDVRTPTIEYLSDLPRSERTESLTLLLVAEFKVALLMTDEDELPLDQSYFDLGLTSLTVTDLKQRIETLLGCEVDANLLFNSPTVAKLVEHLTTDVLADLFGRPTPVAGPRVTPSSLVDDLLTDLDDLYRA
jgi:acyl carrier protein